MSNNDIKKIEKKYDLLIHGMPISSIEDTLIAYWTNNIGNYGGESFEIDIVGNRKQERLLEVTECEYIDIAMSEYEEYEDDCEEGYDDEITLRGESGWYESYDKDMLLRDALLDFIINLG